MMLTRSHAWLHSNGWPSFDAVVLSLIWLSAIGASKVHAAQPKSAYPTNEHGMSLVEFQSIMFTNIDNEIGILQEETNGVTIEEHDAEEVGTFGRFSEAADVPLEAENLFENLVDHGWGIAEKTAGGNHREVEGVITTDEAIASIDSYPFLICIQSTSLKSGLQRMGRLQKKFNASPSDFTPVSNLKKGSCFILTTSAEKVRSVVGDNIHGIPLTDQMKITPMTIQDVTSPEWSIPLVTSDSSRRLTDDVNSERSLLVAVAPGVSTTKDDVSMLNIAENIMLDIKKMAEEGSSRRQRQLISEEEGSRQSLRASKAGNLGDNQRILSISEAFFATSTTTTRKNAGRRLSQFSHSFWSRSLQNGLESEHGCSNMLHSIKVRPLSSNSFEIVLNPKENDEIVDGGVDSSASNGGCVISLIAALSVHRHVVTVEANTEIVPDNRVEQWITQSNIASHRPFFNHAITGKGQIVSVSDTGLDKNNCYFRNGATDGKILDGNWDFTTRKIVKYDNTFKDDYDAYRGHGTHVCGTVVGRKSLNGVNAEETGAADGIARDAKVHFLDLRTGSGGMSDPGASRWFNSFSREDGKGAKIANASWGRSGRAYSIHCANYDGALFEHDDVLLVTSAGNRGDRGPGSIKNPGECKNTCAVGVTESSGSNGKGRVLHWSAKGPTMDNRKKPDLLAPGSQVLSASADPSRDNECDNSGGTRYSSGTSMAAPVVAGNAALCRQYFVDGFYPNGHKSSGPGFEPQGSLLKAVLMNGAQAVQAGSGLSSTQPYDNIQNMGQVNLLASLPLQGDNSFSAIVVNGKAIADQDQHDIAVRIDTTSCDATSLSVTMVYTDPAGMAGCTNCLVNDVNMMLVDEFGKKYYPNGLSSPDTKNPAERIRVENVSHNRKYMVSVSASNLSYESQKYSLIMTGCIVAITDSPTEAPTDDPTVYPTASPTATPSVSPTASPTSDPTAAPAVVTNDAENTSMQPTYYWPFRP